MPRSKITLSGGIEMQWSYTMLVNVNRTLRQRIGAALRGLASRIDKRISLAVEIQTSPGIKVGACVNRALDDLERYVRNEVEAECEEAVFRKMYPHLFADVD